MTNPKLMTREQLEAAARDRDALLKAGKKMRDCASCLSEEWFKACEEMVAAIDQAESSDIP